MNFAVFFFFILMQLICLKGFFFLGALSDANFRFSGQPVLTAGWEHNDKCYSREKN